MSNGDSQSMSEKTGTSQDNQLQQIMKALQDQFAAAEAAIRPQQGGASPITTPGMQAPGPAPNISFNPAGAATPPIQTARPPAPQQFTPTGSQSIGEFHSKSAATNAGLVSLGNSLGSLISNAEQHEQGKKSALAENYLLQINSLLASGDPQDRQKAQMLMDDPKIRKALKTGLEYVPLEEEVPPEAQGVQSAIQKIQSTAGGGRGPMAPPQGGQPQGQSQGQSQGRAIMPQATPQAKLQAALTNALLQKIQQDPASALTMMGQSQLTATEQRADEFYKNGLGVSPESLAKMTLAEKLQGMKLYEGMMKDAMKMEVDLYKTKVGYTGKVDAATVLANGRKYVADQMKSASHERTEAGKAKAVKPDSYAQGAKMYEDMAKKYLDLSKQPNITPQDKARYEATAEQYNQKADQYLNQANDQSLMEDFMKAMESGESDASDSTDPD